VDRSRLQDLLAEERKHLALGEQSHCHIVVSTDNEFEFEFPRFSSSPPYRDRAFAEKDASDPRFLAKVGTFRVDVIECSRACPRSDLGRFGWEGEQEEPYHWWDGHGWGFGGTNDPSGGA